MDGNDSYGCPALHLEAPVWQHACCKKNQQASSSLSRSIKKVTWARFFSRICSEKNLAEKVQEIETTIPSKMMKSGERYSLVQCPFSWIVSGAGDWIGLVACNEALQIVYIIEFKLSTDRDEGFLEVKEAEANYWGAHSSFSDVGIWDLTCKHGSVGQSEGLLIPRSSIRFRLNPENTNSHGFELHRHSLKGTKILSKVLKAIKIIGSILLLATHPL